eukprot:scaffold29512_cov76-Skeletonema_dohrnii-CCMP3373.AAC.1
MMTSLDIPCSLWPVVAMLELTGTCLTLALPKVPVPGIARTPPTRVVNDTVHTFTVPIFYTSSPAHPS